MIERQVAKFADPTAFITPRDEVTTLARDAINAQMLFLRDVRKRPFKVGSISDATEGWLGSTGLKALRNSIAHPVQARYPYDPVFHWNWLRSELPQLKACLEQDLVDLGSMMLWTAGREVQKAAQDWGEILSSLARELLHFVIHFKKENGIGKQQQQQCHGSGLPIPSHGFQDSAPRTKVQIFLPAHLGSRITIYKPFRDPLWILLLRAASHVSGRNFHHTVTISMLTCSKTMHYADSLDATVWEA